MCQALVNEVIGPGTVSMSKGPDGGRDATFHGKAPYPSTADQWDGDWIFQVKYHDTRLLGLAPSRRRLLEDVKTELEKISINQRKCDNFILITNVPLSSVADRGTQDTLTQDIIPRHKGKVEHVQVWGAGEVCRFLDRFQDIRRTYSDFLLPGDAIGELLNQSKSEKSELSQRVRLFLTGSATKDQNAQLDQIGEMEDKLPLDMVFIDLNVEARFSPQERRLHNLPSWLQEAIESKSPVSALRVLLCEKTAKIALVGGPGQGKSTLGQFLAQIHRNVILKKRTLTNDNLESLPLIARIPFRITLRDFAQWLAKSRKEGAFESYLATYATDRAGEKITESDIHQVLKSNPCLLVLDGLDEVTDKSLQIVMLKRIEEFLSRCEDELRSDMQVVATTRPTGYTDQFDPTQYLHLNLIPINGEKALEYVHRWSVARKLASSQIDQLRESMQESLSDLNVKTLMQTPLQVTILIYIVLSGIRPPKQREALFEKYLDVIYRRETGKAKELLKTDEKLLIGLHKYIGYLLHSRSTRELNPRCLLSRDNFLAEVKSYLRFKNPYSTPELISRQADQLVREASERLVLIVEPEPHSFGFELRSFQEFFAAAHLTDTAKDTTQRGRRFEAIACSPHWRNVALFFAGRVGRIHEGEAALLLQVCRSVDTTLPDLFLHRGAWLALDLAADRSFEPERRLQRGAIDYALSLLEARVTTSQNNSIHDLLRNLPGDDTGDHLRPLLLERMRKLQSPTRELFMDAYVAVFGCDDQLLEFLDLMTRSKVHHEAILGLKKSAEYGAQPAWFSKRFNSLLSIFTPESFGEAFAETCAKTPDYMRACLRDVPLRNEFVDSILSRINFLHLTLPINRETKPDGIFFNVSDPKNQLWTLLSILRLIRDVTRQGFLISYREGLKHLHVGLTEDYADLSQRIKKEIREFGDSDFLVRFLSRQDLNPILRGVLWCLAITVYSESPKCLRSFAGYYQTASKKGEWLPILVLRTLEEMNPFIVIMLAKLRLSPESIEDTIKVVSGENKGNFPIGERLRELRRLVRDLLEPEIEYLIKLGWFGAPIADGPVPPSIGEFESKAGFDAASLAFSETLNPHLRIVLSPTETVRAIERVRLLLEVDKDAAASLQVMKRVASPSIEWTADDKVSKTIESFTELVASLVEIKRRELDTIMALVCLKLLELENDKLSLHTNLLPPKLLNILGKWTETGHLNLVPIHDDKVGRVLSKLAAYSSTQDEETILGALRTASEIVRRKLVLRRDAQSLATKYGKLFDASIIRKLITSDQVERRTAGIRLLALCNINPESELEWVSTALQRAVDPEEVRAWSLFFRMLNVGDQAIAQWTGFIEAIIKRESTLHSDIALGALQAYDRIISLSRPGIVLDEVTLGLPLNK